jgi:NAD(P)-dependent dehydrogenase (short-subunit alcohol dehydrogenase family)
MQSLKDKVALITGGTSGIGLATAKLFVEEGAEVIITGRSQTALDQATREIGSGAMGVQGDVSRMDDLDRLYEEIAKRFGHLDIVFANAGVANLIPFADVTEAQLDAMFGINVKGVFFTVQKALPLLRDGASVILTSSIANFKGTPNFSVYSSTKAAVRSLARSMTTDLKHRKIRVNSISPGPTVTGMGAKMGAKRDDAFIQQLLDRIPLGRYAQPEETARVALFLACSDSSFVTGVDLCVDGGMGQV